jgi:hypothetical protein
MKVLQQELLRLSQPKALGWVLPNEADTGLDQSGRI